MVAWWDLGGHGVPWWVLVVQKYCPAWIIADIAILLGSYCGFCIGPGACFGVTGFGRDGVFPVELRRNGYKDQPRS